MPAGRREGAASGQDQHTVIVVTVVHIGLVLLLFRVNSPVLTGIDASGDLQFSC